MSEYVKVSDAKKLQMLQEHSFQAPFPTLDHKNWCLHCEKEFDGHFESRRTGRAGYQPACGNEWVRGVCEKPRVKCSECPHQRFLPVTDEVVRWHLSGRDGAGRDFVMGIYPMLRDEVCHFLAVDFDGDHWREDASAFLETCRKLDVPASLERSRSGNGGHVWCFFEEAVPANQARKLGSLALTETMERRPELGLRSYDRLFPNQDTLPKGGLGTRIAESPDPPGYVPEPRVLPGPGDAAADLRQAAGDRLRGGLRATHRASSGVPRRGQRDA